MSTKTASPDVSIILPVFNDAEWVATALRSCLNQTLDSIEVIVVDDASTDETTSVVEQFVAADPRVRLIRQEVNQSAFQARRAGIEVARAPYVLFVDGDDELVPETASIALTLAREEGADVVAFGSLVIKPDGSTGGGYEAGMQPRHRVLEGGEIAPTLFPVGQTAQGQLWRYLFDKSLLSSAYASLPPTLVLPRMNDLPIAFLALMRAKKYVSTPRVLYRYYFRRGASGHGLTTLDDYHFVAGSINSIESIMDAVYAEAAKLPDGAPLLATYESARLSVTGRVLDYVNETVDPDLRATTLDLLTERVGRATVTAACADFYPRALPLLATTATPAELKDTAPRHVLIRAGNLGTGGVQGVAIAQAKYLAAAGIRVTIAVDSAPSTLFTLPEGVRVIQLVGSSLAQRIASLSALCQEGNVDVIVDHHIFYNERWPYFALAAAAQGVPMIGWVHNFALRPIVDGSTRLSFLESYLPLLTTVVVLSQADVAYWKLRGLSRVVYLPNPPSPLLDHLPARPSSRNAPTDVLELVWWGRLQQSTKQVRDLIEIGSALRDLGVDFRLTIIGPDGPDLKATQLEELARSKGIEDRLVLRSALHGEELIAAVATSHVFVSTSVIEGYPLALVEAQTLGLPLVMYDLPWLAILRDNGGVMAVREGDRWGIAQKLATLAADPVRYEQMSEAAVAAASRALSHDFRSLYTDLVRGRLSAEYSPAPTAEDMRLLLDQNVLFIERLVRREGRALDRARTEALNQRRSVGRLNGELAQAREKLAQMAAEAETLRAQAAGHRAEVRQLSNELEETREQILQSPAPLRSAPPSVVRTGLKGWLQRFLPATMRQAGYYARHHYQETKRLHEQVLTNQTAVRSHLRRIDAALLALQRSRYQAATDTASSVSSLGSTLSSLGSDLSSALADARGMTLQRIGDIDVRIRELAADRPLIHEDLRRIEHRIDELAWISESHPKASADHPREDEA